VMSLRHLTELEKQLNSVINHFQSAGLLQKSCLSL